MRACMASTVCSRSLVSSGYLVSASPQSRLAKGRSTTSRRSRRSGTSILTGQQGSSNFFQLKGFGKPSLSPAPHPGKNTGLVVVRADGPETDTSTATTSLTERSEADRLVDGMTFGELCDEFECKSSPAVESTARQLVRDILELREGNRSLGIYAIFVKFRDPLRSFKGRDKYKRPSWIKTALEGPISAVQEMVMPSTSILQINWTVRGKPKLPPASFIGAEVILSFTSTYTLNQISGQVIEQEDKWELSRSSLPAQAYFWATRLSYAAIEAGKDAGEAVSGVSKSLDNGDDDDTSTIYPDPSGDPRKFFQVEDNPQRDLYQVALVIALLYLLVQFLKLTL